jgi:TPR repeat protein
MTPFARKSTESLRLFRTRGTAILMFAIALLPAAALPAWSAPPNPEEAAYARKVRAKARTGDADAQYEIGRLYAKGAGVWHNYPEATKWYLLAAQQGHVEAQLSIGILYEGGTGVPRDLSKAAHWYRKAAEQGDARAQVRLGYLYGTGQGVAVDHVQAYLWYSLAARQGDKLARINQKAAADQLTSADLARAKERVQNWKPSRPD